MDLSSSEHSDIEDIDDVDSDDRNNERRIRRPSRDRQNPFEMYDANEFNRRFRFDKDSILHGILPKTEEGLARINNRGVPSAPELQLLVCLRYYATASFQLPTGDIMQISQITISRIVFRVSCLLASLISEYIKLPSNLNENQQMFNELGRGSGAIGLPEVDGAIDCTHTKLVSTRFHDIDEVFRNRKGYFSLHVQAVVGPKVEFLDIVPEWPGGAHDSRIFQNSAIYMRSMERPTDGILVGDRGYPCLPFLMTPFSNSETDDEIAFNAIQMKTRSIVERTFGVWKRRFPCLSRGMTTKLLCCTTTVVACAVLHNMSLIFNNVLEVNEEDDTENDDDDDHPPHSPTANHADGFAVREALVAGMFR